MSGHDLAICNLLGAVQHLFMSHLVCAYQGFEGLGLATDLGRRGGRVGPSGPLCDPQTVGGLT